MESQLIALVEGARYSHRLAVQSGGDWDRLRRLFSHSSGRHKVLLGVESELVGRMRTRTKGLLHWKSHNSPLLLLITRGRDFLLPVLASSLGSP